MPGGYHESSIAPVVIQSLREVNRSAWDFKTVDGPVLQPSIVQVMLEMKKCIHRMTDTEAGSLIDSASAIVVAMTWPRTTRIPKYWYSGTGIPGSIAFRMLRAILGNCFIPFENRRFPNTCECLDNLAIQSRGSLSWETVGVGIPSPHHTVDDIRESLSLEIHVVLHVGKRKKRNTGSGLNKFVTLRGY